ncbi:hypothetical protein SAMN05444166_5316 [Singulisphaera sp. GP187]|uniref:hypothetical protein n=1 Tax=Singulisphaera sp. GP187 TaxID=1882752 RepID=UPI00092A4F8E|nr:hypothetical protein [Singulisphaera sp. GP187]SIO56917.1 hypothetical protein SAMN05444166_5316 [Singulisphaera sp. GP187]
MVRLYQITLIVSTLALCWLGMQVVHETGHVLTAWGSGERVDRVVLHPLTISRTDATHGRHPLIVIWGGPILGTLLPPCVSALSKLARSGLTYLFRFFAGFCLIFNGAYLGVGSFEGVGDAGDLLRHGASRWTMIAFGLICVPSGLFLWHGLGPHFGLGESKGRVDRWAALGSLGLLLGVVLIEVVFDSR